MPAPIPHHHVVVIGAGFGGLGMGVALRRAGYDTSDDFVILEADDGVGGTWRVNTYPGCACDVPSHLYSFSFAPNPDWRYMFGRQPEILDYLERCADRFDLRPHLRLRTRVIRADWSDDDLRWTLTLDHLDTATTSTLTADVLVGATGGLSRPRNPDIPGLDTFAGPLFHSARWDHDVDLTDKRVAVIGTGASAIQVVPAIAERVRELHLFQRTPPWILPRPDRPIGDRERSLYTRLPLLQGLHRLALYSRLEVRVFGFIGPRFLLRPIQWEALRHIRAGVDDPALQAALTPDYALGCKRILLSNDYYPAVNRPDVHLVAGGASELTATGVRGADGTLRPVDAVILCTGFQASESVAPFPIAGRDGLDLATNWDTDGASAYLGCAVAGFPNLFLLAGPNSGLGHSSMVYILESQIAFALDAVKTLRRRRISSLEVRADVQAGFNKRLQSRLARTVWASGCASWYQDSAGRNTTLWPGFTWELRARTRRVRESEFLTR